MVRALLRLVVGVFFRQVEVVGLESVPAEGEGPVIFAGNHPNSLLDPVLIVNTCGRIVHFAAKDALFHSRLLRPLLRALGAVPIRRRMDHQGRAVDNTDALAALREVLRSGRAMGIFPEGLSHHRSHLFRLRTGAARIAFDTVERTPDLPLRIVPCGLTYVRRKRFRSRVFIQYGEPLAIDHTLLEAHREDPRAAVRELTRRIEIGLRALTVNAPDWESLRVLDGVRRLYQPEHVTLEQRVELGRRFTSVHDKVRHEPEVERLYARVKAYLDRLADAGLTDRDLRRALGPAEIAWRVARHLRLLLLWLPLALPGSVVHAPLGILSSWAGYRLAPRKDVTATAKLLVGLMGVGLSYVGMVVAAAWAWGGWGAVGAVLALPISGYATLRVLERAESLRRLGRWQWRAVRLRHEVGALREERRELEGEVIRVVRRFIPEEMTPLFPERLDGEP